MPTIKPLPGQADGDGEGQLRPITASTSSPAPAPAAEQRAPAVTAPPAAASSAPSVAAPEVKPPAAPQPQAASAQPGQRLTPKIMTGPRLHKEQAQARREPSAAAATDASSLRNSPYTAEALLKAWNRFIIDNPHEVILVNAMRVSRPQAADTANHTYTMTVINDVQQAKVLEFMPQIVRYLRDALSNDRIEIDVIVNNGEDNASTWNEREVLAHMIENNPALRSFIEEFKLKPG